MSDLIDSLKLQVQTAKPDIFVLTTSTLGAYKLGGAAEADDYNPNTEWLDILGDTTSVAIRRGGKRGDSIDTEVEVGTLEARVYDGNLDPQVNPYIKMGVPVRLQALRDGVWVTQYTGAISRVVVSYDADKKSTVTLYATDRVKDLANLNRAGVVAGTFAERVDDLLSKHGIDYTVTGGTSALADNNYESTIVNHLMLAQNTELGSIFVDKENVVKAYGKGSLPTSTPVLFFTDMKQNASTNLYGTDVARGGEVTESAAAFSCETGSLAYAEGVAWEGNGSIEYTRPVGLGFTARFDAPLIPVTPGQWYSGSAYFYMEPSVDTVNLNPSLRWYDASSNYLGRDLVSFTMDQGVWSRHGVIGQAPVGAAYCRFSVSSESATTVVNVFNFDAIQLENGDDITGFTYPNVAYYLIDGFTVGYDDSVMFNDIFVNNLTRASDGLGGYTSIETKYGPFRNATSVATWGARQTELTTNFATEADVEDYAAVVLDEFDAPELRVDSIRWNATNDIDKVAGLELFDLVNIEYNSETVSINKPFRVLAIEHDITPDAWLVRLDLLDV